MSESIPSLEEYNKAKEVVHLYESELSRKYEIQKEGFRKDLVEYFSNNLLDGVYHIKEFELCDSFFGGDIIPKDSTLEESYDGGNDEDIELLCQKWGVKYSIACWFYHK